MLKFTATIIKLGVNPLVNVPDDVLAALFIKARKNKGPIPVKGTLNGKRYLQTLVKYKGRWRLYLNGIMRTAAGIDEGDAATVTIDFDPAPRVTPMHPKLLKALAANKKAKAVFDNLAPYRQKEIARYINSLKTTESVNRNVLKVIAHLLGKAAFVGRKL